MVAGHTVVMSTTFTVKDMTPPHRSKSHSGHANNLHSDGCDLHMVAGHTVVMSTTFTEMDLTPHTVAGHTVVMSTTFTVMDVTPPHGSRSHSVYVDGLHSNKCNTSTW